MAHEVTLQQGEMLYIPSYWLRYQISLDEITLACSASAGSVGGKALDNLYACGMDERIMSYM
jgi:hypothetical protein